MLSKQLCAQAGECSTQGHTVVQKEAVVLQSLVHGGRVLFTSAHWANQAWLLECLLANEPGFRRCRMIWQALSCEAHWPVYTPADVSDPSFRGRRRLIFSPPGSSGQDSSNLYILPTNPCQHWAERYICILNYLDCHLCIFNAPVSFFPFMALWNTTVSLSLHLPPCVCVCVCGRKILNRRIYFFF